MAVICPIFRCTRIWASWTSWAIIVCKCNICICQQCYDDYAQYNLNIGEKKHFFKSINVKNFYLFKIFGKKNYKNGQKILTMKFAIFSLLCVHDEFKTVLMLTINSLLYPTHSLSVIWFNLISRALYFKSFHQSILSVNSFPYDAAQMTMLCTLPEFPIEIIRIGEKNINFQRNWTKQKTKRFCWVFLFV